MTDKTANTQTDSKQAIPSPEDRVRAIREREQKASKGPWVKISTSTERDPGCGISSQIGDGTSYRVANIDIDDLELDEQNKNADFIAHARADIPYLLSLVEELIPFCDSPCGHTSQYAYSEDGGKNIVCLICEREELKGQVASVPASPQPRCPLCKTSTPSDFVDLGIQGEEQVVFSGCGHRVKINPRDLCFPLLSDFAQFFAAAPAAEARKRKDYHAEYVEAAEAAVKAQRELRQLVTDKEPNRYPLWFNRAVYQCRDCDSEDLCVKHLEMAERDFAGCEQEIELFLAGPHP